MKSMFTIQIEGQELDGGRTALTISANGVISQKDLVNVFLQLGQELHFGPEQWHGLAVLGAAGKRAAGTIVENYQIGGSYPLGLSSGDGAEG